MNVIGGGNQNLIFASGTIGSSIIFRPVFVPTDLPNLLSWYSSDYGVYTAPNILATNGETVSIWQNKINGNSNLQTAAAYPPLYSDGGILFSQSIMTGTNPSGLNIPLNYYIATKSILSGTFPSIPATILKQGSTLLINNIKFSFVVDTGSKLGARNPTWINSQNVKMNNGANVIYAIFSGTDAGIIGKNNYSEIINGIGTSINSNVTFTIGSNSSSSPAAPLQGSIYEILVYTGSAHTTSERNQIIEYLANRWGVDLNA